MWVRGRIVSVGLVAALSLSVTGCGDDGADVRRIGEDDANTGTGTATRTGTGTATPTGAGTGTAPATPTP